MPAKLILILEQHKKFQQNLERTCEFMMGTLDSFLEDVFIPQGSLSSLVILLAQHLLIQLLSVYLYPSLDSGSP